MLEKSLNSINILRNMGSELNVSQVFGLLSVIIDEVELDKLKVESSNQFEMLLALKRTVESINQFSLQNNEYFNNEDKYEELKLSINKYIDSMNLQSNELFEKIRVFENQIQDLTLEQSKLIVQKENLEKNFSITKLENIELEVELNVIRTRIKDNNDLKLQIENDIKEAFEEEQKISLSIDELKSNKIVDKISQRLDKYREIMTNITKKPYAKNNKQVSPQINELVKKGEEFEKEFSNYTDELKDVIHAVESITEMDDQEDKT